MALFDEAITWLVCRGQVGQWGAAPASSRTPLRERVAGMASRGGLHLAEHEGALVGALAVGSAPAYVRPVSVPEVYIELLLSSRRCAGHGIGRDLLKVATDIARRRNARLLRLDCWAGAPRLVEWYEEQGFARSALFTLDDGWTGQVLQKPIASGR